MLIVDGSLMIELILYDLRSGEWKSLAGFFGGLLAEHALGSLRREKVKCDGRRLAATFLGWEPRAELPFFATFYAEGYEGWEGYEGQGGSALPG